MIYPLKDYRELGRSYAPLHYHFAKKINDYSRDYENILCNGRDCYITYFLLKDLFKNEKANYICTSRKVLFNTAWNTDYDMDHEVNKFIFNTIIFGRYKNVYELLYYLNVLDFNYLDYGVGVKIHSAGFDNLEDDIRPFQENHEEIQDKIITLVKSFQDKLYTEVRDRHFKEANSYLSSRVKNNDMFVDIGWNCSTQYQIENLLNIDLNGFYLETFNNVIKLPKQLKATKIMEGFDNTCRGVQGLLEGSCFIAPHGSVLFYKDGKVISSFTSVTSDMINQEIIRGVFEGCCELHNQDFYYSDNWVEYYLKKLMFNPSLERVKLINTIKHNNCGYNYSIVNFNKKYNEIDYKRSFWKQGYDVLRLDSERVA